MEKDLKKLQKRNVVLIVIICLMAGYIIGVSRPQPAYADMMDVQQLIQIYSALQELKAMNAEGNSNTYASMKIMASATGNKQLMDIVNKKSTKDIVNMTQGDWTRNVKNRIEDVLMNVLGKITQKYTAALTPSQQARIVQTRNILSGTKIDKSGAKNEGDRLSLTLGIYNDMYDDMQSKYGTTVIEDGKIIPQDITWRQGAIGKFISEQQKYLVDIESSLPLSDNASLPVHIQFTNQLLIQTNQLLLKILQSQTDLNRATTLATVMDGYAKVRQDMSNMKFKK